MGAPRCAHDCERRVVHVDLAVKSCSASRFGCFACSLSQTLARSHRERCKAGEKERIRSASEAQDCPHDEGARLWLALVCFMYRPCVSGLHLAAVEPALADHDRHCHERALEIQDERIDDAFAFLLGHNSSQTCRMVAGPGQNLSFWHSGRSVDLVCFQVLDEPVLDRPIGLQLRDVS